MGVGHSLATSAASTRVPRLPLQLLQHLPVVPVLLAALLLGCRQRDAVMLLPPALGLAGVHSAPPRLSLGLAIGAPLFLKCDSCLLRGCPGSRRS